ncbi:MAG: transporter substrate-binding domain-containing protein [Saprospiraceae bacterium]
MQKLYTFIVLILLQPFLLNAQNDSTSTVLGPTLAKVLRVGVVAEAPYCMKGDDGEWTGLSLQLWRQVAEYRQLRYELVEFSPEDSLVAQLANGNVDVILKTDLTEAGANRIDYLQNYHTTTLGMALPKNKGILQVVKTLFSKQFWMIALYLSGLLLIIGVLIWLMERGKNDDQFGGERTVIEGIGAGFWWAGVTLTTIGYGDKSPKTLGGRIVAMLWMLMALALTSTLTAAVIGAANSKQTIDFPDDLSDRNVAAMNDSPAAEYLDKRGVTYTSFPSAKEGIRAVKDKKADIFVGNAATLQYLVKNNKSLSASVQPTDAEPVAYSPAVAKGSSLREPLNAAVVRIIRTESWRKTIKEYAGDETD